MSEPVGRLYYEVTLETAGLIAGQRRVDAALSNTTRSLQSVEAKLTQVSNTLAAADAARRAANGSIYAASVGAQVKGMSALAAQNAFAATAAIPVIGPGLAPEAALAAGSMAMAIGAPAIATAPIAGARQYGGPVSAGSMYRVNEGGRPEMFTAANGNQYLMPTQGGRVTPMGSGGGAASSGGGAGWVGDINVNVNIAPDGTARTSTESTSGDSVLARQIGERIAIGTKETMLKELRPGGLLWKMRHGQV
ncbi:MAG: hypothetical protein RBT42_08170 [Aquabacterium sp.]|jgi:hypothetical protein|uniref:hypothetical protein n=1 Tax=Aquabacterium sp. TaxID=1872578 RepID=UPI002A36B3FE|nr:hypothetical protein [Aquabacterium sp.]MDX9843719.1 hypothetical protein [Aquabacterium sp.]